MAEPVSDASPSAADGADPDRDRRGPVFIVGCQRSGTSALWKAIRSHPDLLIPEDVPLDEGGRPILKELWFVREFCLGREANPNRPHADTAVDREYKARFARMVDEYCRERFAGPSGRWVSAHPADGVHVREILDLFPDARVLFLTRHPQEVVWSSLHAPWMKLKDRREFLDRAEATCRWWRKFATLCVDRQEGRLSGQVLVVRHERMIREPEAVARECLAHLEEEYHPAVAGSLGTVFNSSFLRNDAPSQEVEDARGGVGGDAELCQRVVELTGDLMARLDYADLSGRIADPAACHRQAQGARPGGGRGGWLSRVLGRRRPERADRAGGSA